MSGERSKEGVGVTSTADLTPASRPRLPVTQDTAFWVEGAAAGQLLIQRCARCSALRHPPRPMCPSCGSLEWDTVVSYGRGTVYSYVVYRHQPAVGLRVPYTVLVVQLEEGVRVVGNLVEGEPEDVSIGMPVHVVFRSDPGDDLVLPQWVPTPAATQVSGGKRTSAAREKTSSKERR